MKRKRIWKIIGRNKSVVVGILIIFFFVIMAVFAVQISPYDPHLRTGKAYEEPSASHWLGTNDIGQDILSEIIYGTRVSMVIGVFSALLSVAFGTILGMLAGYYQGFWDMVVRGLTNIMMSVAGLPLTLFLVAVLGSGTKNMIMIICITGWVGTARVIRTKVMQLREQPFIKIEQMMGVHSLRILFAHILPNILDMVLFRFAMAVGSSILMESSLSFLGLGTYGEKSWGNVLHFAFYRGALLRNEYWWYLPPIICISLCMLGFTLLTHRGMNREGLRKGEADASD